MPLRINLQDCLVIRDLQTEIPAQITHFLQREPADLEKIAQASDEARLACNFTTLLVASSNLQHDAVSSHSNGFHSGQKTLGCLARPLIVEYKCEKELLSIRARFDSSFIGAQQVRRILRHLRYLMKKIETANLSTLLRSLRVCTFEDRLDLEDWNANISPKLDECAHHMIIRHVQRRPQALAVHSWDGDLTYHELDVASSILAYRLHSLGVSPEVLVPLRFTKSKWAVVAMLGVIKAGGAFVSIDSSAPASRNNMILQEAGVNFILTSTATPPAGGLAITKQIFVDELYESVNSPQNLEDIAFATPVTSSNLLYVIFTSGSTGIPKGVAIHHSSFCSSALQHSKAMLMDHCSRVFQFSSFTFDGCILEILTTLFVGGCICVPTEAERMDDIGGAMARLNVTWSVLTPTVTRLLDPKATPSLKTLVLAGEAVSAQDLSRWPADINLIIGYGPSECAIISTVLKVDQSNLQASALGFPTGSALWVVDEDEQDNLLPIGAEGELIIEGPIVGRCYLNNPSKTAQAFISAPKWAQSTIHDTSHRRFYKSGDIVRFDSDGSLHYVRRKDTQVKLRGQRIELSEVEIRVKEALPDFDVAAEIVKVEGEINRAVLIAFVASRVNFTVMPGVDGNQNTITGISTERQTPEILPHSNFTHVFRHARSQLVQTLPTYMIPAIFVPLTEVPMTTSGKTDRRRLRTIAADPSIIKSTALAELGTDGEKATPVTAIEKDMHALWCSLLNLGPESVGTEDHFFRLGADSITAMRLVTLAKEKGINVTVAEIFRHPTLSDLAKHITLEDQQTETSIIPPFALLPGDRETVHVISQQNGLSVDLIEDAYPCTPLQEGLMLLSIRDGSYIGHEVYKLPRSIDVTRFQQAWETVVAVQPIWRSRIVQAEGIGSIQVVMKGGIRWHISSDLQKYLQDGPAQAMTLGKELCEFALVYSNTEETPYFVLRAHHSLYDGWSIALTLNRVCEAYHGLAMAASASFNIFIQHLSRVEEKGAQTKSFWASYLAEMGNKLLPAKASHKDESRDNDHVRLHIDWKRDDRSEFTSFTYIKAAWAMVLQQFTVCDDIVFGTTISGRNASVSGIENIVGPTITTIPVRARFNEDLTVRAFLEKLQTDAADTIQYEQTGLQNIQRASSGAAKACQFDSLLVLQADKQSMQQVEEVFGTHCLTEDPASFNSYAVTLDFDLDPLGMKVTAGFKTRVFEKSHVGRLLAQLQHNLQQLAGTKQEAPLASLATIKQTDLHQIEAWNKEGLSAKVSHPCAHQLIKQQAQLRPQADAVCAWDGDLSYEELDFFSTRLAVHLSRLGVGPDIVIPLCFEKSRWTIVAMVAVLKAGGGFLSVDPNGPRERAEYVCKHVNAIIGLTSASFTGFFESIVDSSLVIDANFIASLPEVPSQTVHHGQPESIMYVIFTSGSTGQPKGCVIEHRAYMAAAIRISSAHKIHERTRCFQFSSYLFDVAIEDIFTTLISGGCICIASEAEISNDLTSAIIRYEATHIETTPTVASIINFTEISRLQTVVLAGESANKSLVVQETSSIRFINSYGLSECAITNIVTREIDRHNLGNIGYPVACSAWIVNPSNHDILLPIGAEGELLIEGPVLARGYLNQPDLTSNVFISAPLWAKRQPGGAERRFYKTGDVVRYDSNGSIVHLGRKDNQVKLRGQRIELGEVESRIKELLPNFSNAAEMIQLNGDAERSMLVVFLSRNTYQGRPPDHEVDNTNQVPNRPGCVDEINVLPYAVFEQDIASLAERLTLSLPIYMIPSLFIPLSGIPRSTSGKSDRRRLKSIAAQLSKTQMADLQLTHGVYKTPGTKIEHELHALCCKVLRLNPDSVSMTDHFFRLGGDSIMAMRLAAMARRLQLSISVADIFQKPVLSDLSQCVEVVTEAAGISALPAFKMLTGGRTTIERIAAELDISSDLIEDAYPCTALQEGLMLLSLKDEGSYVGREIYDLASVDIPRFKQAWEKVVELSPIWRTVIVQLDGVGTLQVVLREKIKWQASSNLEEYLAADRAKPIGFGDLLSRHAILPNEEEKISQFILTTHHAAQDAWSLSLSLNLVIDAYKDETIQKCHDFNLFINHVIAKDVNNTEAFWKEYLADFSGSLFPSFPFQDYQVKADTELDWSFRWMRPQSCDFTITTLLRAAWAILVETYTGERDVVFGTTLTGRNATMRGIEKVMGPTITTVPFRIRLGSTQTARDVLVDVQQGSSQMIPHEQYGLQNISRLSDQAKQACNFSTLLVIQVEQDQQKASEIFGKALLSEGNIAFTSQPVLLECSINQDKVTFRSSFDSTILEALQVRRMLYHLQHILVSLGNADCKTTLQSLRTCNSSDLQEIVAWNRAITPKLDDCVHEVIWRQAIRTPDATAVCSWDGDLTYDELDASASTLARHLMQLGVGPEVLVPLRFQRSKWAVIAMLGVIKAGGAFVSLDLSAPTSRNNFILKETNLNFILTSRSAPPTDSLSIDNYIFVDELCTTKEKHASQELVDKMRASSQVVRGSNLLYVIFTSGSTGVPKGVGITHSNFSSVVPEHIRSMHLHSRSRVLHFTSFTFDAVILEVLTTLTAGGCICIPTETERMNNLSQFIEHREVNWAMLTPSVARLLKYRKNPTLRTLVLVGEAVSIQDLDMHSETLNVMIGYGPTECCIISSVYQNSESEAASGALGRPVGCAMWIVDANNHDVLLPIGSDGELLIEGHNIGRGYLNNAEMTTNSFISSPKWAISPDEGVTERRFYKTGDIVRYAADGSLVFLGRKDTQVKLRGQRLELGEVQARVQEAFPGSHAVAEVVYLGEGETKNAILTAFLSDVEHATKNTDSAARNQPEADESDPGIGHLQEQIRVSPLASFGKSLTEITSLLTESLPAYMVPSLFIPLTSMPLSKSGKIDRQQLRKLAESLTSAQLRDLQQSDLERTAPETEAEKALQALWSKVLKIAHESICVRDHFFRLGGDSIAAMRLVAAARAENIRIRVVDIFENPVLYSLAGNMESIDASNHLQPLSAFSLFPEMSQATLEAILNDTAQQNKIPTGLIEDAYPCTPLQEGLMLLSIRDRGSYIGREIFKLPRTLDLGRFKSAWEKVINSQPIWRTRIVQVENMGTVQLVIRGDIHWNESFDLRVLDETVPEMGFGAALSQFSLVRDEASQDNFFILAIHHALYDAHSLKLALRQVCDVYWGLQTHALVPFNYFIQLMVHSDLDGPECHSFWSSYLAGTDAQPFPVFDSTKRDARGSGTVETRIEWSRRPQSTFSPFNFIKAAWAILIRQYTACEDVVFGVTVNGRNASLPGIENVVGPTITSVPIRVNIPGDLTIEELLLQIQSDAIKMIPFEQKGLQNIQNIGADTRTACEFNSLLVLQVSDDNQSDVSDVFGTNCLADGVDDDKFNSYALTLECHLHASGIKVQASFKRNALDELQVRRIVHQLQHVLQQLSNTEMACKVSLMESINSVDLNQIVKWNQQTTTTMKEVCAHDLIRLQVDKSPRADAVCAWDGNLTYQELDTLSTDLAIHLVKLGVSPKSLVPLCFEKSQWTVVAMLGVLKAGAGFLSIDPKGPRDRAAYICEQAEATIALTSASLSGYFDDMTSSSIRVDSDFMLASDAQQNHQVTLPSSEPENVMYVIFTSGSTGQPKGCVVDHKGYVSGALAVTERLMMGPTTRCLQFSSYTFDTAIEEIFSTLITGGCVCIPSDAERMNDLTGAINRYRVSMVDLTPSVAALVNYATTKSLRNVVLGGEMATHILTGNGENEIRFMNSYGLTECAITNTIAGDIGKHGPSNIGKPVGCSAWIVSPQDSNILLPIGAEGELIIDGPALARGYLNDPERTAKAFIPTPRWAKHAMVGNGTESSFYKTGDIVRFVSDGSLTYVGRKDSQVKLRGQRIELGEVEARTREALPGFMVATDIISFEEKAGLAVLVAFISKSATYSSLHRQVASQHANNGERPQEDIRFLPHSDFAAILAPVVDWLARLLPVYMIPSLFIPLTALPLTTSGKTDKRKLRTMISDLRGKELEDLWQSNHIKTPPKTKMEHVMQNLWCKTLGLDAASIGREDHFFRLGGDSISVMRLVAAARNEKIQLTVLDVFQTPTLCDLCQRGQDYKPEQSRTSVMESESTQHVDEISTDTNFRALIPDVAIESVFSTTDFQALAITKNRYESHGFMTYITAEYDRIVDTKTVRESCQAVFSHHEILRALFVQFQGRYYHVVTKHLHCEFEQYASPGDLDAFCQAQIQRDLETSIQPKEAAFKAILVKGDANDALIIRISHAQYDGISLPLLFRDLEAAYLRESLTESRRMSYFTRALDNVNRDDAKAFWTRLLEGSTMTQLAAIPKPRSPKKVACAECVISLASLAPLGITFASILKASWGLILAELSTSKDTTFGHLVSGRTMALEHIDQVFGPCINIIPIRVQVESTVGNLLHKIQDQQIAALPFENLGFNTIMNECTSWQPDQRRFTSIIQHQNMPESSDVFPLHGANCKLKYFAAPADVTDAWVITTPHGPSVHVAINYFEEVLEPIFVDGLLDRLCGLLQRIPTSLDRNVSELMDGWS
ncbi:hypothetical protein LT330_008489 [Penicillium expansum]|nr:hypothetical protein LT330_008489 [Penicillium expansum]